MFGWGRGAEVEARSKLLGRMIALIVHGLRTKSYEQFVAAFSNPGKPPDALKRLSHKAHFQMRISPTCWYDASVSYAAEEAASLCMTGGGDDFGVVITASALDDGIRVELGPTDGEKPGRDARVMVRTLLRLPGYRSSNLAEAPLEIWDAHAS